MRWQGFGFPGFRAIDLPAVRKSFPWDDDAAGFRLVVHFVADEQSSGGATQPRIRTKSF